MSTAISPEKVTREQPHPAPLPPPAEAPADVEPAPEERPLTRDWVALVVWVSGALLLVLYHFYDVLVSIFGT